MSNKKSQSMGLRVLIVALLLIITAILLIAAFTGFFKKEMEEIGDKVNSLGDNDCDGVANIFDKCCETSKGNWDLVGANGCAPDEERKKCKGSKKMC